MDVEKAAIQEMCPLFPEPVPLKHPITSLRAALQKVNFFQLIFRINIKVWILDMAIVILTAISLSR